MFGKANHFLFVFVVIISITVQVSAVIGQNGSTNSNPVKMVYEDDSYTLKPNEFKKFNINLEWDKNSYYASNLVINLKCSVCNVLMYITNEGNQTLIEAGNEFPYQVAEVYLEQQSLIENIPYQLETQGLWSVVLQNMHESGDIQVNLSIGTQLVSILKTNVSIEPVAIILGLFCISFMVAKKRKT